MCQNRYAIDMPETTTTTPTPAAATTATTTTAAAAHVYCVFYIFLNSIIQHCTWPACYPLSLIWRSTIPCTNTAGWLDALCFTCKIAASLLKRPPIHLSCSQCVSSTSPATQRPSAMMMHSIVLVGCHLNSPGFNANDRPSIQVVYNIKLATAGFCPMFITVHCI